MKTASIIDVGMGNVHSVISAVEKAGWRVHMASTADAINEAQVLVLPGQGAFGPFMEAMRDNGLETPVRQYLAASRPYLGICLGLQVLYEYSEESPEIAGLGVFSGTVKRFDASARRVPHMGWNLTRGPDIDPTHFYYVHSYYVPVDEHTHYECDYGGAFSAAISAPHLFACQFHPEKSQRAGIDLLERVLTQLAASQ